MASGGGISWQKSVAGPSMSAEDSSAELCHNEWQPDTQKTENGGAAAVASSSRAGRDDQEEDIFDQDEDEGAMFGERLAESQLRMSKPRPLLCIYAVVSLLLGVAVVVMGLASFVIVGNHRRRHSFQIELKWVNLVLLFSGASGLLVLRKQTAAFLCSSICFSLLAGTAGLCTFVLHSFNAVYKYHHIETHNETHGATMDDAAGAASVLNMLMAGVGATACVVSLLLHRHVLHLMGKNFSFSLAGTVQRHRLKLSMLGLAHLFVGLLVTAWWIGIEISAQGVKMNLRELPGTTSAVMSHGVVLAACGYMQLLATSKGNRPILVCAAVLNAAALLLATFFSSKPLGLLYIVLDHGQAMGADAIGDPRVWLCAILSFVYLFEVLIAMYSLIKFLHLAADDSISRVDNLLNDSRGLLRAVSVGTIVCGVMYALFDIGAVSEYLLYKLDPTPLPLYLIVCGLLGYGGVNMGSAWLIALTAAIAPLCAASALRDVYLFLYQPHSVGGHSGGGGVLAGGGGVRTIVHLVLAVFAAVVVALSSCVCWAFTRALTRTVSCLYNKMQFPGTLLAVRCLALAQTGLAAFIVVIGGILFISTESLLVHLGDSSIPTGVLLLLAAVLQLVSLRKAPSLLMVALMLQLGALTLLWQQLDSYSYLIHEHLDRQNANAVTTALAIALLLVYLAYFASACSLLLLQASLLHKSRFSLVDRNARKLDEFVSMDADGQEGGAELANV